MTTISYKKIKLTRNCQAIVDAEDYPVVSKYHWYAAKNKNVIYVRAMVNGKEIGPHRFLLNPGKNKQVDHINSNGLDNRKINLRICSHKQNSRHKRKNKNSSSIYKGVHFSREGIWIAQIKVNRKTIYLGCFKKEKGAAKAYDVAAKKYFGEFTCLNKI